MLNMFINITNIHNLLNVYVSPHSQIFLRSNRVEVYYPFGKFFDAANYFMICKLYLSVVGKIFYKCQHNMSVASAFKPNCKNQNSEFLPYLISSIKFVTTDMLNQTEAGRF